MKKYNLILVSLTTFYLILALAIYFSLTFLAEENTSEYRVEMNRVQSTLTTSLTSFVSDTGVGNNNLASQVENFLPSDQDLEAYIYLTHVSFVRFSDSEDPKITKQFYQQTNDSLSDYSPLFFQDRLLGYLKFDYQPDTSLRNYFWVSQSCLFLLFLFVIGILFYFKFSLIEPFQQLSDLPYELSKGHLNGTLPESKSRYFGKFIWGLSLLGDNLNTHRKKELALEKEKKMLLLSLSHDIKTPLSTIKLYARALSQNVYYSEEEKQKAADQIQIHANEIEAFVKEIMKSSSEDILSIEIKPGDYYLADLMNKVASTYQEKCRLKMVLFSIGVYVNRIISGDMDRIFEVFENILENALKYGDGQKITISFYEEDYCQLIRIQNTGTAVSKDELGHLFDSFFRGSNANSKEGNGLGLYICKQIMKKSGGDIFATIESDGMAFTMVLPLL